MPERHRTYNRPQRSKSSYHLGGRGKGTSVHRSRSREHMSNLKQTQNNYMNFLKEKYPQWGYNQLNQGIPTQTDYSVSIPTYPPPRTPIVSRLETSQYFWNRGSLEAASVFNNGTNSNYRSVELLPVLEPIPSSSLYLETDFPNVRERLIQIRTHLDELKNFRLSMPTTEYFRKVAPNIQADLRNVQSYYGHSERADIPSLAELRARILNLDLNVERRTREILDETYGQDRWKDVSKTKLVQAQEDDVPMPEWLKKQPPTALDELVSHENHKSSVINQLEKTIEKSPIAPVMTSQSQEPAPFKPEPQEEPKSPESARPIIAPNRSFLLSRLTNGETRSKEATSKTQLNDQNSSSKDSDSSPHEKLKPTTSYNALLELLKPKKIEVSSDFSDSDSAELAFGPKPKQTKPNVMVSPPKTPNPTTAVPLVQAASTKSNDLFSKLNIPQTTTADSDDDFFN